MGMQEGKEDEDEEHDDDGDDAKEWMKQVEQ